MVRIIRINFILSVHGIEGSVTSAIHPAGIEFRSHLGLPTLHLLMCGSAFMGTVSPGWMPGCAHVILDKGSWAINHSLAYCAWYARYNSPGLIQETFLSLVHLRIFRDGEGNERKKENIS